MKPNFIVIDGFGDSLRAFYSKESAKEFISNKPDCKLDEPKLVSYEDWDKVYGLPPF